MKSFMSFFNSFNRLGGWVLLRRNSKYQFWKSIIFITVILPIKINFLFCHCSKHFSKSTILGSKFALNI